MNSVFENIIEKLEDLEIHFDNDYFSSNREEMIVKNEAIEIVKQEAEKFGRDTNVSTNGWIPCNELLPAYGQTVLASVCAEDAEWKIIIACYKEEDFWLDGKIDAWQPLPTPYAKGE